MRNIFHEELSSLLGIHSYKLYVRKMCVCACEFVFVYWFEQDKACYNMKMWVGLSSSHVAKLPPSYCKNLPCQEVIFPQLISPTSHCPFALRVTHQLLRVDVNYCKVRTNSDLLTCRLWLPLLWVSMVRQAGRLGVLLPCCRHPYPSSLLCLCACSGLINWECVA